MRSGQTIAKRKNEGTIFRKEKISDDNKCKGAGRKEKPSSEKIGR